jgi:hypothetical protein
MEIDHPYSKYLKIWYMKNPSKKKEYNKKYIEKRKQKLI